MKLILFLYFGFVCIFCLSCLNTERPVYGFNSKCNIEFPSQDSVINYMDKIAPFKNRYLQLAWSCPVMAFLDLVATDDGLKRQIRLIDFENKREIAWGDIRLKEGFEFKSLLSLASYDDMFYVYTADNKIHCIDNNGAIIETISVDSVDGYSWFINSQLMVNRNYFFVTLRSDDCRVQELQHVDCYGYAIFNKSGEFVLYCPLSNRDNLDNYSISSFGHQIGISLVKDSAYIFNTVTFDLVRINVVERSIDYTNMPSPVALKTGGEIICFNYLDGGNRLLYSSKGGKRQVIVLGRNSCKIEPESESTLNYEWVINQGHICLNISLFEEYQKLDLKIGGVDK